MRPPAWQKHQGEIKNAADNFHNGFLVSSRMHDLNGAVLVVGYSRKKGLLMRVNYPYGIERQDLPASYWQCFLFGMMMMHYSLHNARIEMDRANCLEYDPTYVVLLSV